MAIITISRQFGAGGRTLSGRIAEKLGYKLYDDALIRELAKRTKVTADSIKDIERSAGTLFSRLLSNALSSNYMERLTGDRIGYVDENIYTEKLQEIINELSEEDNIVILGRASQYILENHGNTYHFLLVASKEDRIKFMQRFYNYSDNQAYNAVLDGEKRRKNLYAKFGKTDYNDAALYHIVLNMSRLSLDEGLQLITSLVAGNQ